MNEAEIRKIVESVLSRCWNLEQASAPEGVPLEVSARHVHLTAEAVEILFGKGARLTKKRDLSQPGEFLSEQRVKLVTPKGEIANVAVLGPVRKAVQTELSLTDCKGLGLKAPVNLSGELTGAADVLLIGDRGYYEAKGSVIVAKAHIHFTPANAAQYGVLDKQSVRVQIHSARPVTVDDVIVRVNENFAAAMHIDFDEANACACEPGTKITILK